MLTLNYKNGTVDRIEVLNVKVDDMGVAFIRPDINLPTKIFHSQLNSFNHEVEVTSEIEAKSLAYQQMYSSSGPMARSPHSER